MKVKKNAQHLFNFLYYILLMQLILGLTSLLPNMHFFNRVRGILVTPFFRKCGKNFQLAKGSIINMPRNIEIGDNVYIAHNVWINGTGNLYIGNDVIISPNVVIATTKHKYINKKVSIKQSENSPIFIGKGSWIASNSTISLGANIGEGSIIGANSTVTDKIEKYIFAAGNPAKKIKDLG